MIDQAIIEFDKALRTVFAPARSVRPVPGEDIPDAEMSEAERAHAAALMRVNHVGEVCAQALYQGQSIMSRDPAIRDTLRQASQEETEHLAWTERRIAELGGRKSLLNPLWYGGALAIGVLAGRFGDRWNLGFLAETERQVETGKNGNGLAGHQAGERGRLGGLVEQNRGQHHNRRSGHGAVPWRSPIQRGTAAV